MHSGIINNTRYDDPRKLMKQTSFTLKKTYKEIFLKINPL